MSEPADARIEVAGDGPYRVRCADAEGMAFFRGFVDGSLPREVVAARNARHVYQVTWNARPHIVKVSRPRRWLEPWLVRLWRGSYAGHLFRCAAGEKGRPFTAEVCWVAEGTDSWTRPKTLVAMARLEGKTLADVLADGQSLADGDIDAARSVLAEAHRRRLVSGDPNPGNFIRTPEGMRLIDLNGKAATRLRCATDRVLFEEYFGHPFPPHDGWYALAKALYRARGWRRRFSNRHLGRKKNLRRATEKAHRL